MSKQFPNGLPNGQGRAQNTLQLRNLYTQYLTDAQTSGQTPVDFKTWAMQNFPQKSILNQ